MNLLRPGLRTTCFLSLLVWSASAFSWNAFASDLPNPSAPVPPLITSARRVFVSNAGADSGLFPHPFTGSTDRPYHQFYAALRDWQQYDLVANPSDSELVFELQLTAPSGPSNADKSKGASDPLPMFQLTIYDQKSHYILWRLTESIEGANLQKTHDHNFDVALASLMTDLKLLTGK